MPARQSAINFLHPVGAQHAAPGISTWRHRSDSGSGAFSDGSNRSRARRRRALGVAMVDRRDFSHRHWNYPAERSPRQRPALVPLPAENEITADVGRNHLYLYRRHRILQSSLNPARKRMLSVSPRETEFSAPPNIYVGPQPVNTSRTAGIFAH